MRLFPKITLLIITLLFVVPSLAQQVTKLSIDKPMENQRGKHKVGIDVCILLDSENLITYNEIDFEKSRIAVFKDDTGKDLAVEFQNKKYNKLLRYVGKMDNNEGVKIQIKAPITPDKDAKHIQIKGAIVFNFLSDRENETVEVKNIPVPESYDDPPFDTKIGLIKLEAQGETTVDDARYNKYIVRGINSKIESIELISGNNAGSVDERLGLIETQFILKDIRKTVDLKISYKPIGQKEVPIDLNFSIGLN